MQILIGKSLVHFNSIGERNNKSILFLPGWMDSGQNWHPLCLHFSDRYRCIIPDLPGFGSTIADFSRPWDVEDYSKLVVELLAKIKVKPDIIIAHSFGGKIAVQIANNYRLKKIILISPSIAFNQTKITRLKNQTYKFFKIPASLLGEKTKNKLARLLGSDDYKNAGELMATFKNVVSRKMVDETKSVKAETLIIWGDKDQQVNPETAKEIYKLVPKSKIRIVWGIDHNVHINGKDKLIKILREEGL